jgi:hypothetical protein
MKRIKQILVFTGLFLLINSPLNARHNISEKNIYDYHASADDTVFLNFSGVVLDFQTKNPIVFASVIISGTNAGTVTNTLGEFILKVPAELHNSALQITSLGYNTLIVPFNDLSELNNIIYLQSIAYPIAEVEIRNLDPIHILREALRNATKNYGSDPRMLTAFYRETIRQNRNYVAVSEAVFEVYKSGYGKMFDSDRVKIFKARKSQDVSRMDTVLFKLQGGPYNIFLLDLVRHPGDIFSGEAFAYYDYEMRGTAKNNNRDVYMISFKQKEEVPFPLYDGNIFIDTSSKAVVEVEFSLSDYGIEEAADYMVVKKPSNMKVDVLSATYRVNYRNTGDLWVLSYARSEVEFRVGWQRKLFKSNYFTMTEVAVTDVDTENLVRFKVRESTKSGDILSDQISYFSDPEFWGDYNIIRPEQTIEEAIEKLNKRLRRNEK